MWRELKPDLVHPTSEAEAYYGDLVTYGVWQTHQAWAVLGPHTRGQLDAELSTRPLPPPLTVPTAMDSEVSLACFTFDKKRLEVRGDPRLLRW